MINHGSPLVFAGSLVAGKLLARRVVVVLVVVVVHDERNHRQHSEQCMVTLVTARLGVGGFLAAV